MNNLDGNYLVLQGSSNGMPDLILKFIEEDKSKWGWLKLIIFEEECSSFPIQLLYPGETEITRNNETYKITDKDEKNGIVWMVKMPKGVS